MRRTINYPSTGSELADIIWTGCYQVHVDGKKTRFHFGENENEPSIKYIEVDVLSNDYNDGLYLLDTEEDLTPISRGDSHTLICGAYRLRFFSNGKVVPLSKVFGYIEHYYTANMSVGTGQTGFIDDVKFASKAEAIRSIKASAEGERKKGDAMSVWVKDEDGEVVYRATCIPTERVWHRNE